MVDRDTEKRQAGIAAADSVTDGMALGLGSGSTVYFFLEELGRRVGQGLKVSGIPTSNATARLAVGFGIPLTTFDQHPQLDLDVDGADEVDPAFNLIKGAGGALLREKIIAQASRRRLIIVDETKMTPVLGAGAPLPVEVVPFAAELALRGLRHLGAQVEVRAGDGRPYVTDNSNWIVDCRFDGIDRPAAMEQAINAIPGVMENGLFVDLADEVLVARSSGVERLVRFGQSRA